MKITRSYSQTVQVKDFEPVTSVCTIEDDCDSENAEYVAKMLANICMEAVANDIKAVQEVKVKKIVEEIKPFE